MTEQDEKLSVLLDDSRGDSVATAVDAVIGDVNLQYRMRRFQMIGEVMRHELPPAIDTDFRDAVMARVNDEAGVQHTAPAAADRGEAARPSILDWVLLKPVAGVALAVLVAVTTVALWQPQVGAPERQLVNAEQEKIQQLAAQLPEAVRVSTNVQPLGTRWKVEREDPLLQQKLNAYLVNHTEYSNPVQGLIPQARVAGFDSRQQ